MRGGASLKVREGAHWDGAGVGQDSDSRSEGGSPGDDQMSGLGCLA